MSQPITTANAASTTRITLAAAVVFAGVAVALGVVGLPEREPPSTEPAPPFNPGGTPDTAPTGTVVSPTAFTPVDSQGVAARLAMLGNAPQIPVATPIETPTNDPGPIIDPSGEGVFASISDRVRYMGMVQLGETRAALVRVDGRQQMVREKASIAPPPEHTDYPALTIERITGAQIVVSDGETRAPVQIATRSGPSITMAGGGNVTTVDVPADNDEQDPSRATISNQRELPQREIDRRARMIERQRSGTPNMNPAAALRPPEVSRTFNAGDRRNEEPGRNRREE